MGYDVFLKTYPGSYSKFGERLQEPSVADGGGGLDHSPSSTLDAGVQAGPLVEVHPGEVQLTEVPRVVHVVQQRVNVVQETPR
jgi:hypothetical protein